MPPPTAYRRWAPIRFATNALRLAHYDELRATLVPVFASRTPPVAVGALREAGVPNSAVRSLDEVFADPQAAAREMLVEVDHATLGPVKVTGRAGETLGRGLGAHGAAHAESSTRRRCFANFGYDQAGIEALVANGAVRG
ncbi:MAG: CoA transferase [Vicinamibacterales bacterium]